MTIPKRQRKNIVNRKCSNPTFTTKLDNRRLKLEILAANTTLSGNLFQNFMTRLWNIAAIRNSEYTLMTAKHWKLQNSTIYATDSYTLKIDYLNERV